MTPTLWVILGTAVVAGGLRWWLRRRGERRSFYDDAPFGVSVERYQRQLRFRHLRRRLFATVIWAIGGAAFGSILAAYVSTR